MGQKDPQQSPEEQTQVDWSHGRHGLLWVPDVS